MLTRLLLSIVKIFLWGKGYPIINFSDNYAYFSNSLLKSSCTTCIAQSAKLPTLGLLNMIQAVSMLVAPGAMRSPAATPLWNRGHRFMLGTTSMCVRSTVVPRGGTRPLRHSRGMVSGSLVTGHDVCSVNIPL